MQRLTLPSSGQINAVIHISDVHIKVGDLEKSRYNDFAEVFDTFEKMLMKIPQVKHGSAVTVYTGDAFHFKNKLDSLSVKLFNMLVGKITNHTPLYIIQGNHDFLQSNSEIPDVVSSLLYNNRNPMVNYLDHTGYYIAGTVGFGLVSIKDVLKIGNGCGYVDVLPPFPNASEFPSQVTTKIALFHGTVNNSLFYNGQCASNVIPIDWIKSAGYQLGLFGDVHKTQIGPHSDSNFSHKFTYGYSGSGLQLDFGEDPKDHGFLLWDLVEQTVSHYDIPSPTVFLNVCYDGKQFLYYHDRKSQRPLTEFNTEHIKHMNIKIKSDISPEISDRLQDDLHKKNITCNIVKSLVALQFNGSNEVLKASTKQIDISHYNSQEMWIDYIQKSDTGKLLENHPWKEWIITPEKLLLFNLGLKVQELDKTVKTRDAITSPIIDKLMTNLNHAQVTRKLPFRLLHMEWDWILCYGRGNFYDFKNSNNKIVIVNGPNSSGKTSFLETLCYGLYGQEIPSRKDKSNTSVIICRKKPAGESAHIIIAFSVGDVLYKISKTLALQTKATNNIHCKKITLEQLDPSGKPINFITSSVREADDWISKHVGTFESFIMSCMITQNSDCDFYSLKDIEQIKMLDEVLHLDCIEDMANVINKTNLALSELSNQCLTMRTYLTNASKSQASDRVVIEKTEADLFEKNQRLKQLKNEYELLHVGWQHLSEKDLSLSIPAIHEQMTHYKQLSTQLNIDDVNVDKLMDEKAIITDRIKSLVNYLTQIDYDEKMPIELQTLETHPVQKPSYDRRIYQQELNSIERWKSHNAMVLDQKMSDVMIKMHELEQQQQFHNQTEKKLYDRKPNRPEIDLNQYKIFDEHRKRLEIEIQKLDTSLNTPEKLRTYCHKNPLQQVDNMIGIYELTKQLTKCIKGLRNPALYKQDDSSIAEQLEKHESSLSSIMVSLDECHRQIKSIGKDVDQISKDLRKDEIVLNEIGYLIKPSVSHKEVQEWLDRHTKMSQLHPQQKELVIILEKKYSDLVMKKKMYEDICEKLKKVSDELVEIDSQHIPFNPKCSACRQAPWKVRQQQLKIEQETLITKIRDLKPNESEISTILSELETVRKWIDSYDKNQQSFSHYQQMNEVWNRYNQYYTKQQILLKSRSEKQDEISSLHKKETDLRLQLTQIESQKRTLQQLIDDLHDIINKKPHLMSLQQRIDVLDKWARESKFHTLDQDYTNLKTDYHQQQKRLIDENAQWTKEYEENSQKLHQCDESLVKLKQTLSLLTEYEEIKSKERTASEKMIEWDSYEQYETKISQMKSCIYHHRLEQIDELLKKYQEKEDATKSLQYWQDVQKYKPMFLKKQRVQSEVSCLEQIIQTLNIDYGHQKSLYDSYQKTLEGIKTYDSLMDRITRHASAVKMVGQLMSGYRIWLYENVVVPEIAKMINSIASDVLQCSDYSLKGSLSTKANRINIDWSIITPTGSVVIGKIGGFIKSLFGLITRVSLSRQGCMNINNTQLFMDESFVNSDSSNLEKIPQFLSNLLEIFPNGIYLMSHIDLIKTCGNLTIEIHQNPDHTSLIRFGNHDIIPLQTVVGRRKLSLKLKK